ncbi:glycosyltransferase family 4 protein [Terasakiella pusilla]|uniref:glycosyltransferase family 4 protein n=1 Tax=Terasakiella pusilla TaxID=64973 RepID=UPI003AA80C9E
MWEQASIIDRELEIYREHAKNGIRTTVISYGGMADLDIAKRYDFINVLCNQTGLHYRLYAALLPILHCSSLKKLDIYKTNQMYGAHVASRCAQFFSKPLVVRQGYSHYENRAREAGIKSRTARKAFEYEGRYLRQSEGNIFTTSKLADDASERHRYMKEKNFIVPNFVDPVVWSPPYSVQPEKEMFNLFFVGRMVPEKNLVALINACKGLPIQLTLIGDGPLRGDLERLARVQAVPVTFPGKMPQSAIVTLMRSKADGFVLPSLYEGHPKALIEAMAFGMPVLAANSPGIREEVKGRNIAILSEPSEKSLRINLKKMISLTLEERMQLGESARSYSLGKYSIVKISQLEHEVLSNIYRNYNGVGM